MPPRAKVETAPDEPMTREQVKQYDSLVGQNKYFIRIDANKKPWPEAKEFIWSIVHQFRSTVQYGAGFRIMFQIQKLYRNQFIEVEQRQPDGKNTEKVKKHKPFRVMGTNEEGQEELVATGDRLIDAELFVKEFAIDKTAVPAESLMAEVSADEEAAEEAPV